MSSDDLFPIEAINFSFAKPAVDRTEPLFWIREIRFLRKFSNSKQDEIRRIEFKKGLNIIWAEPPITSNSQDRQRIAGHATGKTTLCRMIRYLLGESHFASDPVAMSIRQTFPEGWVVAHIRVHGESWCIGRAFMTIRGELSEKTGVIDDFLIEKKESRAYQQFRDALAGLLPEITSLQTLPNNNELTFWHLLPWFTRDQDSQYIKLTEWRDNALSNSASPLLALKHSMLVMRSIIEPDVTREMELISQQSELQRKQQEKKNDKAGIDAIIDFDTARVRNIGQVGDANAELDDIYLATLKKRYEELLSSICVNDDDEKKRIEFQAKRDKTFSIYQTSAIQYNDSLQAYRQTCRELREYEKAIKAEESKFDDLDEIQLAAQRHPDRKYCCVPLTVALEEGCKSAIKATSQVDFASYANLLQIKKTDNSELEQKRDAVNAYNSFLKQEKQKLDVFHESWKNAEMDLAGFLSGINQKRNQRAASVGYVLEAIKRFEQDKEQRERLHLELEKLAKDHKDCSDALSDFRDKAKRSSFKIRGIYNDIIRYILGLDVKGDISFSGGEIELSCSYQNSALSSAALNAVKNICFDLAAMVLSVNGDGSHPRFLIHDGPRVSDLAAIIFRYYFSFAYKLEKEANDQPNFQYIITTTEPPPEELQTLPWLVCKLDAAHQESRLLKCNLG